MTQKELHNRLQRLEGQLQKLHADINDEKECTEVIPQFLAVKGALAGAFEMYVQSSLDACAASDAEKMKKLIGLLVRS